MGKKKKTRHPNLLKNDAVSIDDLISRGLGLIRSAKFRDAIDTLKLAAKKGGGMDMISPLLFEAYLNREKQLRAKGMALEADAIHQHVVAYMPEPHRMTPSDVAHMIADCPINDAFSVYAARLKQVKDPDPQIERVLAGRLFENPKWELADALPDDNALKKDRHMVREAVSLMQAGQWEKALLVLNPVGRKSPYSDIRLFCRAMADFYTGNDADMKRALSLLPEEFPLKKLVEALKNRPEDLACLWEGKNHCETEMAALLAHFREGRYNKCAPYVEAIGNYLSPDDPYSGISAVIEHFWALACQSESDEWDWLFTAKKLLPAHRFEPLRARLTFLRFNHLFEDAGAYISILKDEFTDPQERDIARSLVLMRTVKCTLSRHINPYQFVFASEKYKTELGATSGDPALFIAEMAHTAVCLDPGNPEALDLLAKVPRASKKAQKVVEDGLKKIMDHFPDDPGPCLELANLYYESNAFRKAENVLKEAVRRAPHDRRVEERRHLSLLISADQSIRRGRFDLAKRDIESAMNLKNPKMLPLVIEKQIVFKIENTGQLSLFDGTPQQGLTNIKSVVERHISSLPVFDRLRVLGLLLLEYRGRTRGKYRDATKDIEKVYRSEIRGAAKFSSAQIRDLLTPLDLKIRPLIHGHNIALEYLSRTPGLIQQIDDVDIFPVFHFMIAARLLDLCLKEIRRRLKSASRAAVPDFKFHEIAVLHFTGELVDDLDAFMEILDDAVPADMERLRQTSRRLSSFAGGDLRIAMERFDFNYPDDFEEPFDDFDDMPGFEGNDLENEVEGLIGYFEMMIDEMNLRGAPARIIKKMGEKIFNDPGTPGLIKQIKDGIANSSVLITGLSHEAKILITGKG